MKTKQITLNEKDAQTLQTYAEIFRKDEDVMVEEAFKLYFDMLEEKLHKEQTSQTSFDYDEFWDGVDI
jgi:hypothetical protein